MLSIPESIEVSVEEAAIGTQFLAGGLTLPEGVELRTDPEALAVNVVAAPTEADLEAEIDTEGAGVVEDAPESAEADAPAAEGDSESSEG